ncbi:MAG: hypothetical protein KFF50_04045, partial [Desulfatitalea sp.]|nr:hypothetical protein [Desulfatitalea sp.]
MTLFNKYLHPANFAFAHRCDGETLMVGNRVVQLRVAHGQGIHHLEVVDARLWPNDHRCEALLMPAAELNEPALPGGLMLSADAGMQLHDERPAPLLAAADGEWFGLCGRRWIFRFALQADMQFYGLGEKHVAFQRPRRAYQFRNSDVWADHPLSRVAEGDYDPDYLSVPYLIIKQRDTYIGLLVDAAYPAQITLGATAGEAMPPGPRRDAPPAIILGASGGRPSLYILYGPSLAALTRRFQRLVGTTPLPPLWALGYHQCRWGYRGHDDLVALAEQFRRHRFPVDALWLDIDYMDAYRVFTFHPDHLPRPLETTTALARSGLRVVPIIDPGIKAEPGYTVYDSGQAQEVFCRNPQGQAFTGMAWPGQVVFPDFSLPATGPWWGNEVNKLLAAGFEGFWLDMNEPSTGPVDDRDMLFQQGQAPHDAYHNSYGRLMARATRQAMLAAYPDRRPFLLSRAGCTGSQRYCAHWTGDNYSNYNHLRRAIGKSVNLALSGIPFNGPDVGGFGGDCDEKLLVAWFKAGFLFPFFRNHTMRDSRAQEPWAYSAEALATMRHYVRLRYRLLPYLYNLFIDQEERGEAILRPLFYDFDDTRAIAFGAIDDQFMVGPAILQAPFVQEKRLSREVALPPCRWYRADTGTWVSGDRHLRVRRNAGSTPLFLRQGSIVPFQMSACTDNQSDLNRIGLLCCLSPGFRGQARYRYRTDDG